MQTKLLIVFVAISALALALTVTQQQNVAAIHQPQSHTEVIIPNHGDHAITVTGDVNSWYHPNPTDLSQFARENGLDDPWLDGN